MKRMISLLLVFLLLALTGCGARPAAASAPAEAKKLSIVATIFPPYDFARAITGGLADVSMLVPPASETHSFEPTPQDVIKIQNCDVFLYIGGDSDAWVDDVLSSMDTSKKKVVTLIDCVDAVEEEHVEGMEEEEEEAESGEEAGPEYDEHVWTSPENAGRIVEKITDALCDADAGNAEAYRENAKSYQVKLDELDQKFRDVVAGAKRKTIVFGDRFPFRYFADAYGLDYYAAFPGCATETEASAATVKFLIDKINEESIPVVFHIELSNEKMADAISEATGAKVRLLHACHNISKDDFANGVTYLDLMTRNADALKEALQ